MSTTTEDRQDAERFRALSRLLEASGTRVVLTGGFFVDLYATETDYDGQDQYTAVVEDALSLAGACDLLVSGEAMQGIDGTPPPRTEVEG